MSEAEVSHLLLYTFSFAVKTSRLRALPAVQLESLATAADSYDAVVAHAVLEISCMPVFGWALWTLSLSSNTFWPLLMRLNSFPTHQSFNIQSSSNPLLPGASIFPPFPSFSGSFFHFPDMVPSLHSQGCYGDLSFLYTSSSIFSLPLLTVFSRVFCFWLAAFLWQLIVFTRFAGWVWLVLQRTGISVA